MKRLALAPFRRSLTQAFLNWLRRLGGYDNVLLASRAAVFNAMMLNGFPVCRNVFKLFALLDTELSSQLAVEVLPRTRNAKVVGPTLIEQSDREIWVVPRQAHELTSTDSGELLRPHRDWSSNAGAGLHDHVLESANYQLEAQATESARDSTRLNRQGVAAQERGDLAEALRCLQQAIEVNPDDVDAINNLGNLYQDLDQRRAAIDCYERVVQVQPDHAHAHRNLGVLASSCNDPHRALKHFSLAQQAAPSPLNLVLGAKVLPVIYDSAEQLRYWRERVEHRVRLLVESAIAIDTTATVIPTTFSLAYQGENDRGIVENLARVYRGVEYCPKGTDGKSRTRGKRIRVGFVSAYFCNHTIGRLNYGIVQRLSRKEFEVTVIALHVHNDRRSTEFREAADHYVEVPSHPGAASRKIAELGLDILIFADVGMSCLAQALSHCRMAPVQAVTWGHPDTTGSSAIDYFISTGLAEPPDAVDHYSEQLVRLPAMGIYYERPKLSGAARSREYFGLDAASHIYLCPQTLFKFHPEFDEVLQSILSNDPAGQLVLIEGTGIGWSEALRSRWQRTMPEQVKQVRFIPSMPHADFLQLLKHADVILDTFPFCGGNSSYEALALGMPIVTLPGRFLRGRLTDGLYRRMRFDTCVANTSKQYVEMALRLSQDRDYRSQVQQGINEASSVLYENMEDVQCYESLLRQWCQ